MKLDFEKQVGFRVRSLPGPALLLNLEFGILYLESLPPHQHHRRQGTCVFCAFRSAVFSPGGQKERRD